MTSELHSRDVERFRDQIESCLGLAFGDAKLGLLDGMLRRRLKATNQTCETYLHRLTENGASEEIGAIAHELTVPETYFFRNIDQFHAFAETIVPERIKARGYSGRLRILSAGCASGEEAYTLAILLRETLGEAPPASIRAVDINPVALERAHRGLYSSFSLRETPPEMQQRWFTRSGRDFAVDPSIRSAVTFEQRNLAVGDPELWRPESYDVVLCRNVLMYFTPHAAQALVERIARALVPGGFLFLGHAETLRGLSSEFQLCHTNGTFYYQQRAADRQPLRLIPPIEIEQEGGSSDPEDGAPAWMNAIRSASDRVQQLAESSFLQMKVKPAAGAAPSKWDLGQVLALLQQDRIAEALESVEGLPAEAAGDPDVLLLRAVLFTHRGHLQAAEAVCRLLLTVDDLNAGAHYLLALCREGAGDLDGAADADRIAVYLDPGFAMPRLHLGLLARRAGRADTARRELSQAITLLQREDTSRVLLFGGGFSREALIALCRGELVTKRRK